MSDKPKSDREIVAQLAGLSAEEVEKLVTVPLEAFRDARSRSDAIA